MNDRDGPNLTVTLCGGGSSAHVLVAMGGARPDIEMRAWVLESELEAFGSVDAVRCDVVGATPQESFTTSGTAVYSADPAEVVPGSDVVVFCGPISVYPTWMEGIAPHLDDDTIVGGLFLQGIHLPAMGAKLGFPGSTTYFGFGLYPFASRIVDFGSHVTVLGAKTFVNVCMTGPRDGEVVDVFERLITVPIDYRRQPHFLACVLSTTNALTHPARMHGIFREWDGPDSTWNEADLPLFYEEMDEYSANVLDAINHEALRIRDAISARHADIDLSGVRHRHEVFKAYGDHVGDDTSLLTCYRTNHAYRGITAPVEPTGVPGQVRVPAGHRYFQDDIPFGLCVFRYLADMVDVAVPEIDRLIEWGQRIMGREYLVDGQLAGADVGDIPIWGYSLDELVAA